MVSTILNIHWNPYISNTEISKDFSYIKEYSLLISYFFFIKFQLLLSKTSDVQKIYFEISVPLDKLWLWDIESLLYTVDTRYLDFDYLE